MNKEIFNLAPGEIGPKGLISAVEPHPFELDTFEVDNFGTTTYRVWFHPSVRTSAQKEDRRRKKPPFLRYDDFVKALEIGSEAASYHANVRFVHTKNSGSAHFRVWSSNADKCSCMRLSNSTVAGGLYRGNGVIYIHDGWIPAWSFYTNYSFWFDNVTTLPRLARLLLHEMGHKWISGHGMILSRLWNKNKNSAESRWARRKWGAPLDPTPELTHRTIVHIPEGVRWEFNLNTEANVEYRTNNKKVGGNKVGKGIASHDFALPPGDHNLEIKASNSGGTDTLKQSVEIIPPTPELKGKGITETENGFLWKYYLSQPAFVFYFANNGVIKTESKQEGNHSFEFEVPYGEHTLKIEAENAGGSDLLEVEVERDPPEPPTLNSMSFKDYGSHVRWKYQLNDEATVTYFINDRQVGQDIRPSGGAHRHDFHMGLGTFTLAIEAENVSGSDRMERDITRDNPFHNKENPYDVSGNGQVTALDVLRIINALHRNGGMISIDELEFDGNYYDVNNDRVISTLDALQVINQLNRQGHQLAPTLAALLQEVNEEGNEVSRAQEPTQES